MKLLKLALGIGLGRYVYKKYLQNQGSALQRSSKTASGRDLVDEASEASFPASDPPSYTGMSVTGSKSI
jgi:hypothetical protein